MTQPQYIRNLLDLPESVPRCVVEINTFDAPDELRDNVDDYVITDTVAEELRGLVDRIVASVRRHEPGDGHYVHGAFGSGKSHFMGILGLILSNNPVIWEKDHPVIREIQAEHGAWLAENPILVVPIYMLGKKIPFQYAMYESANERLAQLGYPPCEFSEADKVIERFRRNAERYGDVVWQEFQKATGYSQERFQRMAAGDTEQRDAIAQAILQYEGDLADVDRRMLYPDSISRGVEILTRHAQQHGFKGVVYLVDELILYLTGKPGKEWLNEFGDVVAAVDNRRTHQVVPLWLVVARQKDIPDIAPAADAEVSEQAINEEMEHHQDRFPRTTRLPDRELVPIVEERVLRRRNGDAAQVIEHAIQRTVNDLAPEVRETLVHDFTLNDFQRLYPFHPALITTLIDVTARLSRERTAIRLLYELLIERHPELMLGELVPYASLFDTVFEPEGITGNRQHPEMEAVWDTYYNRLLPIIEELSQGEASNSHTMQEIVKTVLLAQLSTSLRDQITVERILHLNYTDLKGRTDFGSQTRIHSLLNQLANRTELVNFQPNPQAPAKATVSITVTSGPQLSDALKRVPWNVKMRHDAFAGLLRPLLGNRSLREGELQGYSLTWRGIERGGQVLFRNVRELLPAEMSVPDNKRQEFILFIDYPWDDEAGKGASDDRAAIKRGQQARGEIPVGFWLPQMLDESDPSAGSGHRLKDLDEYAQLLELENSLDYYLSQDFSKRAREEIANKLPGYRQTKERNLRKRLTEAYLGGEVTFLDPAIQPNLFVESMNDALDRIAREVFRRLHPHHPRFQRKVTTPTLRRFLDEVLVKAEQASGAVDRNVDREDLARSIGEPLEIVEVGTNKIGLRSQSRYLVKVNELAQGRRVDADKVRRQLQQAFGFTDEVVDLFLLYLIKGKGYRVLRNGKPVDASAIDFGRLGGVTLERGQQLEVHQWTQVKTEIADTWGGQFQAPELTIAAQDELWQEVGRLARDAEKLLKRIQSRLDDLIRRAGGTVSDAPRMQSIAAALDLNRLPQRDDLDSYAGLRALLEWKPEQEGVERRDAKDVIRQRSALDPALDGLSPDTVKRISAMANGGDSEAVALQEEARRFLTALQRQADLNTHVQAWSKKANDLIDKRLSERLPEVSAEGEGKPAEEGPREKRAKAITITEAALVVRGQKRRIDPLAQQTLETFFKQAADPDIAGPVKVEVRVEPDE